MGCSPWVGRDAKSRFERIEHRRVLIRFSNGVYEVLVENVRNKIVTDEGWLNSMLEHCPRFYEYEDAMLVGSQLYRTAEEVVRNWTGPYPDTRLVWSTIASKWFNELSLSDQSDQLPPPRYAIRLFD